MDLALVSIVWVVVYDIMFILMPLLAHRGPNSVRASGFAMTFFFVVLGVLSGASGNPMLASAFMLWFTIFLLPLFRLIALLRRQQKIPWHLVLVTLPGCSLALFVGAIFQFLLAPVR